MKNKKSLIVPESSEFNTRAHKVLFCENTPFKPKRVELKNKYTRKSKHKGRDCGL